MDHEIDDSVDLHNKIINKTQTTKNQKHFGHYFGEHYLANHFAKFLPDRIKPYRVGASRATTDYTFFLFDKNLLVKFS